MRKFVILAAAVAVALIVSDTAHATYRTDDGICSAPAALSVSYSGSGFVGDLDLSGQPGTCYDVFDCNGMPVAHGMLEQAEVVQTVRNAGPGPDGMILWVATPEGIFGVTDPEWDWN
jgi:hypothetical protein